MMSSSSNPQDHNPIVSHVSAFVHNGTLECAVSNLCVPCMYKIYPTGTTEHLKLPPNVRPEMCPRAKSIDTRLYRGLYTAPLAVSRILTVGDGDLSFSLSIAKYYYDMFGTAKNVLATTHESYDSVCATYQDGKKHIDFLTRFGALVCHEVDATDLNSTLPKTFTDQPLMDKQFHFILWNFPCIRVEKGADGQVSELEQNRILIRRFFANAQAFLVPTVGEVHLAHKTIEPFSWWGITDIAIEERFYCERTIVFDRCNYPGYINRKVLDKKSFPCNDALVYVFRPIVQSLEVNMEDAESMRENLKKKKSKKSKKDRDYETSAGATTIENMNSSTLYVSSYMNSLTSLDDASVQERLHSSIQQLLQTAGKSPLGVSSTKDKKSNSSVQTNHTSTIEDSHRKRKFHFKDDE